MKYLWKKVVELIILFYCSNKLIGFFLKLNLCSLYIIYNINVNILLYKRYEVCILVSYFYIFVG